MIVSAHSQALITFDSKLQTDFKKGTVHIFVANNTLTDLFVSPKIDN